MTDERDIVERLRHCSQNTQDEYLHELTGRAADELTRLRAALAAWQEPQTCPKCSGSRIYMYDENHSTVCDACCPHDQGWWQLLEHYGENNGRWCCKRGCGRTVAEMRKDEA